MFNNKDQLKTFHCWVFDLDGTLIDSWKDLGVSINILRQELDLEVRHHSEIHKHIGWGVKHLLAHSLPEFRDQIPMLLEKFKAIYGQHLLDNTKFYSGIRELLDHLSGQNKSLAVLTNKPYSFTMQILEGLSAAHYFSQIIGGDTLSSKKPDPQGLAYIHKKICETQSISNHQSQSRASMVMVGDTQVDLDTAQSFGCPAIIFGEKKILNGSYFNYNNAKDLLADLSHT